MMLWQNIVVTLY